MAQSPEFNGYKKYYQFINWQKKIAYLFFKNKYIYGFTLMTKKSKNIIWSLHMEHCSFLIVSLLNKIFYFNHLV